MKNSEHGLWEIYTDDFVAMSSADIKHAIFTQTIVKKQYAFL